MATRDTPVAAALVRRAAALATGDRGRSGDVRRTWSDLISEIGVANSPAEKSCRSPWPETAVPARATLLSLVPRPASTLDRGDHLGAWPRPLQSAGALRPERGGRTHEDPG